MLQIYLLTAIFISISFATAQVAEQRGTQSLTEGRSYFVAFPLVWAELTEKPTSTPMMLLLSSRTSATVFIRSPAVINDAARLDITITLEPNVVYKQPISTAYITSQSETMFGYGIAVTSDQPISVSTLQLWNGNGEIARHLPIAAWGTEYYSMNFYQDRFGQSGSYKHRPSQILIVASEDSTMVTYTPTVTTEGGAATSSVAKGNSQTIRLNRGETFLIHDKINTSQVREFVADLSGTLIRATKPIGVVSGHTKGSAMRYPDATSSCVGLTPMHFVRNNMHDVMLPIELAGKKFITVPCMYTQTRVTGNPATELGVDDDRGDVIRVIATEDRTTIKALMHEELANKWRINRGETRIESALETAGYWESDKPILMGQYGKSYAKLLPPSIEKIAESIEGYPSVEAGMPMLQMVPSLNQYVNYATFTSVDGMDNFLNIVCRNNVADTILIDGRNMKSVYAGSIRPISGTDYIYIRTPIGVGDHVLESVNDTVRWMAWTYGSLDGLTQGRSYGTPVSIDYSIPCRDTIYASETVNCGSVEGTIELRSADSTCGAISDVYVVSSTNYTYVGDVLNRPLNRTWHYTLNVQNKLLDATATIRTISRSGKYVEKTFTYVADKVTWFPNIADWGALPINSPATRTLTITNPFTDRPLTIRNIKAKTYPSVFGIAPITFTLPPGASQQVEFVAVVMDTNRKIDTAIVEFECYGQQTAELRIRGGDPSSSHDDEAGTTSVMVSPIPFIRSQHQYLTIDSPQQFSVLSVYDVRGTEMYRVEINNTTCRVPASVFGAPGLYVVRTSRNGVEFVTPVLCIE